MAARSSEKNCEKIEKKIAQAEKRITELQNRLGEAHSQLTSMAGDAVPKTSDSPTRKALPTTRPRNRQVIAPSETECPVCSGKLKPLGESISEQLDIINTAFRVIETVRPKLACSRYDCIVQAPLPPKPIERNYARPGLLARIIMAKFAEHLPLYRQAEIHVRQGMGLSRNTMGRWVDIMGEQFRPLYDELNHYVLMPGIGASETPVMFCGGSAASDAYSVKGTAESGRESVAVLARGNPFQMLAAATALSVPMVGIVGADGFGVHLYADSTAGKTTAEDFGASLYGLPERQRLTWYGTALGIANEAEAHNDGLLCLDEIGQGTKPHDVYTSAYTLFNGKGKLQGDKSGGNRVIKYWKTVVISTGETSVESYLMTTNIRIKAGQLVRLLNIPVTHPEELHGYQTAKEHADALKDAWTENHGAAGREWIKYLAAHQDEARKAYKAAKERWVSLIPASYGEQVFRVSDRFAVLEAALITGSFITGWGEQDCRDALQHVFNVWVAEFGTGNKEREQIIDQTTAFLVANSISRFIPVGFDELSQLNVHNIVGYTDKGDYEAGGKVKFYVLPATFKHEIAKHFDANKVASVLHNAGMLKRPASGKGWQVKTPRIKHLNNKQLRAYAVVLIDEEEVG